jgi:hypothetical protein
MFWATPPQPPAIVQLYDVEAPPPSTGAELNPFNKGQWSVDLYSCYTQPLYDDRQRFIAAEVGVDYALINHVTVSIEVNGYYLRQPGTNGGGGGFNVRGRYEFLRFEPVSLFVDGSLGLIESDYPVPDDATHFNFCESLGVGFIAPIVPPRVFLEAGARFEHISNAGLSQHNSGYEGLQLYAGVMVAI